MARRTARNLPALENILKTVGESIRLARLRRKLSAEMLSERAGMARNTLRSIERGEGGVTIGAYASVLMCLGLERNLLHLADDDTLGRKLQDTDLTHTTKRVSRAKKTEDI